MDGLLGYPRQPIISRPPDAVQRLLPRLSQDSLHQLERNAKEPTAAHKASRVRNWVQDLSAAVNPILDATVKPYQNDLRGPTQGPTQSAGRSGQPSIHSNTAVPRYSILGRVTMGHTTTPLPDSHAPVIDLTEPSNKRPRLFDYGRPSSQLQDKRVQPSYNSLISRTVSTPQPLNRSNSTSRFSQPASTPTLAAAKPSNPVNAKSSPQKNSFIDLANDQKAKGPEKEDVFKTKIQDVFPDICEDYVKTLYAKHDIKNRTGRSFLVAVQDALDEILAKSPYPKHVSKKRKRDEGVDQDDLRRVRDDKAFYFPVAFKLLVKHYPSVPLTTVKDLLTRYKTFLKTYIALHSMGRPASDAHEYWRRLHSAKDKHPALFAAVLEHELQEAKKTIAAKEGVLKKREEDAIEKLVEEGHRVAGTLVECQCCFTEVPPDRTVPCEGDEIHLFCNSCIKQKAEVQVGSMQYELKCFDTSGCQANFSSKLIRKVIGDKLMKRLEDLQQQDEIAKASIDGLEECPFCDFKAICPPVEQNKEFTCLNSDCEKVSCRLCKEETHIPQTCEEAKKKKKKERGIEVRHTVEEAMSAALIRKCPKCGLAIVKEDGCNKLKCRCGALICDVCKKDISKDGYMHFQVKSSTCNLHEGDTGIRRRMNEVMQAEKAAMAEVLAQGGKIDPEMLRVTSKEEASANQQAPAQRGMPVNVNRPRGQVPQVPQMPQIQMPQLPQMPQVQMPRMQQMPQMPQFQMLNAAQIPQHRVPRMAAPILPQEILLNTFFQMPRLATPNPLSRLTQSPRVPEVPIPRNANLQAPRRPVRTPTPATPTARLTEAAPQTRASTSATPRTTTAAISTVRFPSTTAQQQTASAASRITTPAMPTFRRPVTTPQQTSATSAASRTMTPALSTARLPARTAQQQTPTATTASIHTEMRRQQSYRQATQPQIIPPPLQRTNSTSIPQTCRQPQQQISRQQPQPQPQQQPTHQHRHFLRPRSGNS